MDDKDKIMELGGPKAVCQLLGWPIKGGVPRIHNWMHRGIPAQVKVEYPELFMPELMKRAKSHRSKKP